MNAIEERFQRCGLSFSALNSMLRAVAINFLGYYRTDELIDEFVSEGWMVLLEMIDKFDPDIGIKFTSFVWPTLLGRFIRHLSKIKPSCLIYTDEPDESTEDWDIASIFEVNPYFQTPERFCECVEKLSLWQKLKNVHSDAIHSCMQHSPKNSNMMMRKRFSRNRRNNIMMMQDTLKKMKG